MRLECPSHLLPLMQTALAKLWCALYRTNNRDEQRTSSVISHLIRSLRSIIWGRFAIKGVRSLSSDHEISRVQCNCLASTGSECVKSADTGSELPRTSLQAHWDHVVITRSLLSPLKTQPLTESCSDVRRNDWRRATRGADARQDWGCQLCKLKFFLLNLRQLSLAPPTCSKQHVVLTRFVL
jgi:hypothetical protein